MRKGISGSRLQRTAIALAAATMLTGTVHGLEVGWQPLLCLVLWGAVGFALAVRAFRWE